MSDDFSEFSSWSGFEEDEWFEITINPCEQWTSKKDGRENCMLETMRNLLFPYVGKCDFIFICEYSDPNTFQLGTESKGTVFPRLHFHGKMKICPGYLQHFYKYFAFDFGSVGRTQINNYRDTPYKKHGKEYKSWDDYMYKHRDKFEPMLGPLWCLTPGVVKPDLFKPQKGRWW